MFASGKAASASAANYIEDVFSTYLHTGTGAAQTITNGIDLSTKGGLVWQKDRSGSVYPHYLFDTARGMNNVISSNSTAAQATITGSSANTNGFTSGIEWPSGDLMASWTFRKQPKFFDVVTYTGNGLSGRTVAHSLGSVPGCIIVKNLSNTTRWLVYHKDVSTGYLVLNETSAPTSSWGAIYNVTSTNFAVDNGQTLNGNGQNYVAYVFAHDAGGFGLTGTDNVISCGSYSGTGAAGNAITLGYEPQWVMVKRSNNTGDWMMFDNMRGMANDGLAGAGARLQANLADAEVSPRDCPIPTATGFVLNSTSTALNGSGSTYIYIAIRRGPMKVPTNGTSVFSPVAQNASNPTSTITTGFPVDFAIATLRGKSPSTNTWAVDRLRGSSKTSGLWLNTNRDVEQQTLVAFGFDNNSGYIDNFFGNATDGIGATSSVAYWNFRRAPSFFDEVCYTGTGANRTVTHNLGVVPEMMIVKQRSAARDWAVYTSATAATNFMYLNATDASGASSTMWNDTSPTSSVFTVGTNLRTNVSAGTYVAYLFATCAGVSKVGSYTGTGTTKQVDCGFTGGARFVLIKRTDSTGDWYVWDTARGIVAGNDPYLLLNSTAAEVTSTDYIDTYSAGFEISSTAPAAINASGGTFIFLAIA